MTRPKIRKKSDSKPEPAQRPTPAKAMSVFGEVAADVDSLSGMLIVPDTKVVLDAPTISFKKQPALITMPLPVQAAPQSQQRQVPSPPPLPIVTPMATVSPIVKPVAKPTSTSTSMPTSSGRAFRVLTALAVAAVIAIVGTVAVKRGVISRHSNAATPVTAAVVVTSEPERVAMPVIKIAAPARPAAEPVAVTEPPPEPTTHHHSHHAHKSDPAKTDVAKTDATSPTGEPTDTPASAKGKPAPATKDKSTEPTPEEEMQRAADALVKAQLENAL